MNFIIDTNNGAPCASTTISFTAQLNSGTWATTADVLAANNLGNFAAVHVFAGCTALPGGGADDCAATGFSGRQHASSAKRSPRAADARAPRIGLARNGTQPSPAIGKRTGGWHPQTKGDGDGRPLSIGPSSPTPISQS